jgi:putative spermidine/putrescine transport system ATP-binding protein
VGAPAEVYEQPATTFVAGFVGVSNLLSGDAAKRITGHDATVTVRPEKIHMVDESEPAPSGSCTALGVIGHVSYLGAVTRYGVDLDEGGRLVVLAQNQSVSSEGVASSKDRRVRLWWDASHNRPVGE